MFGAAAPAGAATESFALSSAAVSGQSSVTWQGPPVNPPSTPNPFPDAKTPITLGGQIDSSSGAISGAALSLPAIGISAEGENTTFAFSEVHPGTATGNFNSSTGAVTLNDSLTLTFSVPAIPITCVSTPINVAFSGTWDSTTQNVTLAASGFTIPQFPGSSGTNCSLAAGSLNASPGGTAGAVGNAFSIALHGQFAQGQPTTTSLAASPNSPQLAGSAVTLTATVTDPSSQGTPTGSVAFFDNGANIGTGTLSGTGSSPTATLTTSTLPAGANQQLTATYAGDATYATSTSSATSYTITPLPTLAPTLPASITVPSASTAPTVSAVSPDGGPTAGGTQVTITGTGFTQGATVNFGSTAATGVTVTGGTQITATSPAGSTGTVDVTVTTPGGTSDTSTADQFSYGPPTVTAVSPNTGPASTFFEVTITGTGFTQGATVNFGSTPAAAVVVNSDTSILAETPKASAGTVDVTITTPGGTSATSAADRYTYSSAPAVSGLSIPAGPPAGNTPVTISGDNFTGATAVNFGSTPAASFTVNAAGTSISTTSPAGTGTVDVTVTTPNGTSATWLYDQFTYGPPAVTGVSPSGGPAAGGTPVTITGTGFAPNASGSQDPTVIFGSKGAASVVVNSGTSITATPKAGTGTVDVTVRTNGGTSATSPADQFTYGPTVTAVSPPSGPTAGNTAVTITGTSFTGATAVNFGTTAATGVTVVSPTEITATSPAGSAGAVDVTVTTPIGTSATSAADQFFYGAPTVTAVSPNAGPTTGGTTVTVSGAGFAGATAVKFGSTPATSYTVVSPTQLTAVSPGGSGLTHVVVTTNGGSSSASAAAADFTYNSAPSVTSLTPDTGSPNGGTLVTITGVNFVVGNAVSFGSTPATNVTVVSPTTITATSPSGSGAVDVTVTSSTGTSATGPGDVFAYGAPTITNVAPNAGVTSGGTSVVVTGTGFVTGTTVKFGTTAATSVTVTSPTSITAVSPAQAAGSVDITATTPGGTSITSTNDVFTYSAGGAPGQASLTITNPSAGQSWDNLYVKIVLSGITSQPASNITFSYQDASGGWCPLTLSGTSTITTYFSGVGSSCGNAGSFSLAPGASLTVPIQLTYASGTYMGAQVVTATLYSGTCSSPTSCTQSGALNGAVVGSGTVHLVPPALFPSTVTDNALPRPTTPVQQGFDVTVRSGVAATVKATGTPAPTGSVEYLVDGSPATLTADDGTSVANPVPLNINGITAASAYISTSGLSLGVHTLTEEYSGDSVFAPSTLTESFTVLPAPEGTAFSCSTAGFLTQAGLGYVATSSPAPSPTTSGSSAWVHDASASVNLDPATVGSASGWQGSPGTITLSPDGSANGTTTGTYGSATVTSPGTNSLVLSGVSAAVPVTGDPGSTVPIGVGSFSVVQSTVEGDLTLTCTPVSGDAPLTSVTLAGNTLTASPSGSAAPGAQVTLTDIVSPAPPTGTKAGQYGQVTFYDGSTILGSNPVDATGDAGNGTATFTTNQLAAGDHQLNAVWSGGGGLPANTSNTVDYQVGTSSTTTLVSSSNPANAANPVTFTATVNGSGSSAPTGDVSFSADGTTPASCQNVALSTATPPTATCKLSFKAGTTHSVVATYSGDATYLSSASDPLSQRMLPGTTSTLTTPKNPAPAGNVTFWDGVTATGGGAVPTGTVAFTVDNKASAACAHQPLGPGGGASCTLNFKAGTTHTVSATYAGSSSYSGSKSNTITLKVSGASSATKPKVTTASATLGSGKTLTAGQDLTAGSYKLTMQSDGNLVEYQGAKAIWATGTSGHPGTKVTMQKDGNLVEYQGGKAIWASNTSGHAGAHLTLQGSDGNVVIYDPGGQALWSTDT